MDTAGGAAFPAAAQVDPASVSLLGHDLRAAVSDVIGGLRLIDQSGLDGNTRLQLERVRAAGEVLARLLEQELSLLQGEPAFVASGNVHLSRLLNDLQVRWAGRAQEKGLGFRIAVAPDVPQILSLDRIALERVMSNILSNAVKFTDSGEVRFTVDLTHDGTLRFRVEDDGPGYSDLALSTLYLVGTRQDGRGKPGLGLGMRITRDMIDRLGGLIDVCNSPGAGAAITITLPAASWTPAQPAAVDMSALPDLSKIRVLLADDSLTNQAVIGNMLASLGAEFEVASDGMEAMHWLDRERFDLALLDIEMPRLSGLEVLQAIRAKGGDQARMPVLAITAYVLRANREAIYQAGATGILAKPVLSIDAFGRAIQRAIGRGPDLHETAANAAASFDQSRFDSLMAIAGPVSALELLNRLQTDLRQVERGLVAGLAEPDLAMVRGQTHVLIALAGAVGDVALQHLAESTNHAAHQNDPALVQTLGAGALHHLDRLIHFISSELAARQQTT